MNLEMTKQDEILVVTVAESRMEAPDAGAFREALFAEIDKGVEQIILNLESVQFIDSTSIGAIVSVMKKIGRKGEIVVCGAAGSVRNVFRLTRMDNVLRMTENRTEAMRLLAE